MLAALKSSRRGIDCTTTEELQEIVMLLLSLKQGSALPLEVGLSHVNEAYMQARMGAEYPIITANSDPTRRLATSRMRWVLALGCV